MDEISFQNVCFSYPQRQILKNFSWSLKTGHCVRVAGPNGAGKSTFLSLAIGLIQPSSGKILFGGDSLPGYLSAENNALHDVLDPGEEIEFWLGLQAEKIDFLKAEKILKLWGFGSCQSYKGLASSLYSTGMKRRLALAIASLLETSTLCLDEPTWGLDLRGRGLLKDWLMAHKQKGGSILLVSHEPEIFQDFVDEVLELSL